MKKSLKRSVTLIEVIIALSLTLLILTTLSFFYRQINEMNIETERLIEENFKIRYMETRLGEIIPKIISETDTAKDFIFMSLADENLFKPGSQNLLFTFDKGVCLDKLFSNHVLARIYLKTDGHLMIAYWPSKKRWDNTPPPIKKELLMKGVEKLFFEFFIAPKVISSSPIPDRLKGTWSQELWLSQYTQLPAMMKMNITLEKESRLIVMPFLLPHCRTHIILKTAFLNNKLTQDFDLELFAIDFFKGVL